MAPVYLRSLSSTDKEKFLDSFDTIITDCDGVLWIGDKVINKAPDTINKLNCLKKCTFYVTNNSTKTKSQLLLKFQKYGFQVSENHIFNTSSLTAKYLSKVHSPQKLVYIVGSNAISEELRKFNIKSFGPGEDDMPQNILENLKQVQIDIKENVGAVVVGFDENINYMKMLKAATYLKDENCFFVSTNTDETYPCDSKYIMPGSGAILAGIKVASGREPFIIGKPSTYVARVLIEEMKIDPKRTLFVGDRCNTDILMGNKCSFKTLLVLSGVHSLKDVSNYAASTSEDDLLSVPQYYTDSISDLIF